MNVSFMTDGEIAKLLGERIRAYRVASSGLGMTREQVAKSAGVSLSALERLENGGNPRLMTLIPVLREFGLLDAIVHLVPEITGLTPMEIIEKAQPNRQRAYSPRAPRQKKREE